MVVAGDRDPFVPVDAAAALARQLPDGRLFIVPDSNHEVMVRRPGLFNEGVGGFYRSTEAVATSRANAIEGGPG
jgi:pimeloyl-ACP methyl ester carboxylesterase